MVCNERGANVPLFVASVGLARTGGHPDRRVGPLNHTKGHETERHPLLSYIAMQVIEFAKGNEGKQSRQPEAET